MIDVKLAVAVPMMVFSIWPPQSFIVFLAFHHTDIKHHGDMVCHGGKGEGRLRGEAFLANIFESYNKCIGSEGFHLLCVPFLVRGSFVAHHGGSQLYKFSLAGSLVSISVGSPWSLVFCR